MSEVLIGIGGRSFRVRNDLATDISVPMDFHGEQPRHFGAPPATAVPLEVGGFVGDTSRGGSCNCQVLTLIPHCNGTHTESASHVVTGARPVGALATDALIPALLLSVGTGLADSREESSSPPPRPGDRWITAGALRDAVSRIPGPPQPGLVVRTLPNDDGKRRRDYGGKSAPPYFSTDAVDLLLEWDVRHLLIDLPSLDRTHDEGLLTGHRRFWGLPPAGAPPAPPARPDASITEMVFVPDRLTDGLYALSLQIAPFVADAAPSRPLLYPLEET